jgi:hypothetical protein
MVRGSGYEVWRRIFYLVPRTPYLAPRTVFSFLPPREIYLKTRSGISFGRIRI